MPGSFDSPLTIDEHGCLTRGPLGLAEGETVLRLDIWIFQDRAGCMASCLAPRGNGQGTPGRWRMNQDPQATHFGEEGSSPVRRSGWG